MKRSVVRLLAFLSALVMLMGVFAVHAEEYAEYSGGLSVAAARAANGYDTDVYVCVDGLWRDIGDLNSVTVSVTKWGFTTDYDVARVADLPAALYDFGFDGYANGDTCFPSAVNGYAKLYAGYQEGWTQTGTIPMGTVQYDQGESFVIYYVPVWGHQMYEEVLPASLVAANSFYSINIEGLSDTDMARVNYGDAYDTDFGHVVFTGGTATVTVPRGAYTWSYDGTYGSVTINEQADTVTYTFENVTDTLTLTAEAQEKIYVTVQQVDYDGLVTATQTYELDPGSTLPADAFAGYNSQYKWYNEQGGLIVSPSTMTFNTDTVITTKPTAITSNVGANFFVYLDGSWKRLDYTTDTLYGPFEAGGSRYLLRVSDLEAAFGPYGFDADTYTSADRRFAYNYANSTTVWADTTSLMYYGEWALPLSVSPSVYDVYYLPDNKGDIFGAAPGTYGPANAFHTVTLTEEETGATAQFILEEETLLSDWLKTMAGTTLPGFTYPVSGYQWENTDTGAVLTDADTAATVQNLTASRPTCTVTLTDKDGNVLGTVEDVLVGASIASWMKDNAGLVLADGMTLYEHEWMLPNNTAIGTQVFQKDTTLVGEVKPVYTVTFVEKRPGSDEAGGSFNDSSEAYTTVQVMEGETIPAAFIARMRQNIILAEDWAFVEWQYEGNEGYLVMDSNTPIIQDTIVWADYTQEVYVRFWTDRSKTTQFAGTGMENQPVGKKYQGAAPDEAAVLAAAPVEGMRFRYWYDLNTGTVFTLNTDLVRTNLDLYPVFERAIFSFNDKDTGEALTVLYDGTNLAYEPEERPDYYYAGLEVTCNDGTTVIIPNGTEITRDYLTANNIPVPTQVNGRYNIPARPVYKQQRTVVYHTGDDAQFIIYGAEDQESYTVKVDDELILLGALDIINVTSPIGLALDGWTTTPGGTQVQYAPNAIFEGGTALDGIVGAGETVHLYPVWAQQENTIAVTFVSQYPDDAVDANNNALVDRSYTIYIKEGSKPTMPTLATAGMRVPANICNGTQQRYLMAGWSRDEDGKLSSSDTTYTEQYGTYTEGSQYLHPITEDVTFYAIWVDKAPEIDSTMAFFHIRLDGTLPIEPSQYTQSGYLPGSCSLPTGWTGTIKKQINVVNNVAQVEANILEDPDLETIYNALAANNTYAAKFANLTLDDYGTKWWIDWYACKFSCGTHYHVDGRVRFADQVELNYHPNGGSNVPNGTVHDKDTWATVNNTRTPVRENFIFIGWDEDPSAKIPDYPAPGYNFPEGPNLTDIFMDADKDLYAIWQPVEITIPMDDDFKGQKYEQTNNGVLTPPREGRRYQFTIEAISLPEGASPYAKRTVTCLADGTFTFPQIHVQVPGMYVFEVREVIGNLAVQYDTAVYRLTINIVESDYGLGIAGYSFTRNNKVITVDGNNVDNVVFTFTNRTDIRSVTATKVWDDANNQDGVRPPSVNVTLRRAGDSIFSESATLTAAGNWTWTWEDLDIKDASSGEIYEYYIIEDTVPLYTTTYSGDMNAGLMVTNSYTPHTADFPVEKIWQDDGDAANIRPETLTYILIGSTPDGNVVSTTVSDPVPDPWSYTFEDMPLYKDGQHLLYTMTEVAIPGYKTTITTASNSDGGADYHVTNTLDVTHVTVTKQIAGNAAHMDAVFPFTAWVYDADGLLVTDMEAGEGYTVDADGTIRFSLGHEGSVQLRMLPLGGTIVLAEENGDYVATYSPAGAETTSGMRYDLTQGLAITVTNTRETPILTGVTLDTVPYLLLLGLALSGLAGLVIKRRAD